MNWWSFIPWDHYECLEISCTLDIISLKWHSRQRLLKTCIISLTVHPAAYTHTHTHLAVDTICTNISAVVLWTRHFSLCFHSISIPTHWKLFFFTDVLSVLTLFYFIFNHTKCSAEEESLLCSWFFTDSKEGYRSICVASILADFCVPAVFLEHSRTWFHETGYYGVRGRNDSKR